MPRKSRSYDKHVPEPDPRYGSVKYAKFINYIMERGKKNVARKIFYDALDIVGEKIEAIPAPAAPKAAAADKEAGPKVIAEDKAAPKKLDGRAVFDIALKNVAPIMELKSRRIGGANYQIPQEVLPERKIALAIKWMIQYAKERKEHRMSNGLASEIIAAAKQEGAAWKKKEDVHRMAEANKAYSHFKIK